MNLGDPRPSPPFGTIVLFNFCFVDLCGSRLSAVHLKSIVFGKQLYEPQLAKPQLYETTVCTGTWENRFFSTIIEKASFEIRSVDSRCVAVVSGVVNFRAGTIIADHGVTGIAGIAVYRKSITTSPTITDLTRGLVITQTVEASCSRIRIRRYGVIITVATQADRSSSGHRVQVIEALSTKAKQPRCACTSVDWVNCGWAGSGDSNGHSGWPELVAGENVKGEPGR